MTSHPVRGCPRDPGFPPGASRSRLSESGRVGVAAGLLVAGIGGTVSGRVGAGGIALAASLVTTVSHSANRLLGHGLCTRCVPTHREPPRVRTRSPPRPHHCRHQQPLRQPAPSPTDPRGELFRRRGWATTVSPVRSIPTRQPGVANIEHGCNTPIRCDKKPPANADEVAHSDCGSGASCRPRNHIKVSPTSDTNTATNDASRTRFRGS